MTETSRKGARRSLRLVGLPAAHVGRAVVGVGKRLGGRPAEMVAAEVQARTAAQLFQTLGELKGGAMKVGQALSAMEAALPDDLAGPYRDALERLQEAAPSMPAAVVHGILEEELGPAWRKRFRSFDDRPAAAASLGQVHQAVWEDGTTVAVKIQYPGAADALSADLRQLDRVTPLARLGAPSADLPSLFRELRQRLGEELDYQREADAQRAFAVGFASDADGDVRDRAGLLLLRLLLSAPERVGRIHGDPHPGNFRVDDHGRLVVLDFGSSEPIPGGWPPHLGRLLRAGLHGDGTSMYQEAVAGGLVAPGATEGDELLRVLDPWLDPVRAERFHFERSWLQGEVRRWSDPRSAGARLQRKVRIPAEHMLVQRVAFGLLGVLTSLSATVPVRAEVERWIPDVT